MEDPDFMVRLEKTRRDLDGLLLSMEELHEHEWSLPASPEGNLPPEEQFRDYSVQLNSLETGLQDLPLTEADWRKLFVVASGPQGECVHGAIAQMAAKYLTVCSDMTWKLACGSNLDLDTFLLHRQSIATALDRLPLLEVSLWENLIFVEHCRVTQGVRPTTEFRPFLNLKVDIVGRTITRMGYPNISITLADLPFQLFLAMYRAGERGLTKEEAVEAYPGEADSVRTTLSAMRTELVPLDITIPNSTRRLVHATPNVPWK